MKISELLNQIEESNSLDEGKRDYGYLQVYYEAGKVFGLQRALKDALQDLLGELMNRDEPGGNGFIADQMKASEVSRLMTQVEKLGIQNNLAFKNLRKQSHMSGDGKKAFLQGSADGKLKTMK